MSNVSCLLGPDELLTGSDHFLVVVYSWVVHTYGGKTFTYFRIFRILCQDVANIIIFAHRISELLENFAARLSGLNCKRNMFASVWGKRATFASELSIVHHEMYREFLKAVE